MPLGSAATAHDGLRAWRSTGEDVGDFAGDLERVRVVPTFLPLVPAFFWPRVPLWSPAQARYDGHDLRTS